MTIAGPSSAPVTGTGLAWEQADGSTLFCEVDVSVVPGLTGLVGANGVGKTTLLRILMGDVEPTGGTVVRTGLVGWLPQHRGSDQERGVGPGERGTVADALGVSDRLDALRRIEEGSGDPSDFERLEKAWDLPARVEAELERIGLGSVELERPFASLSGGERTRVALARLTLADLDAILLDEPTNDLDVEGREALLGWMADRKEGVLVVTHDRDLLRRVDRIVELTPGGARVYGGGWELFASQRAEMRRSAESRVRAAASKALRERREAQARIEAQDRSVSRGKRAADTTGMSAVERSARRERSAKTGRRVAGTNADRVESARDELREAKARLDEVARIEVTLRSSELRASREVISARGLGFARPLPRGRIFSQVDLRIRGPERIAITGPNGSGKSTLLRILAGDLEPTEGIITRGLSEDETAWLDQRAALLGTGRSVLDAFRAANPESDLSWSRHALARYLFEGDAALAPVDRLSGGERIRAALACTVGAHRPPKLLYLDEPTNHLDLESLEAVEAILGAYDGALVVVSHDRDFLDAIGIERRLVLGR